jgi:hypothetical protein
MPWLSANNKWQIWCDFVVYNGERCLGMVAQSLPVPLRDGVGQAARPVFALCDQLGRQSLNGVTLAKYTKNGSCESTNRRHGRAGIRQDDRESLVLHLCDWDGGIKGRC